MARHQKEELSDAEVERLMVQAQAIVDSELLPEEHLPDSIYRYVQPISIATCQGAYATTMMLMGSMAALSNGACVRIWSQKPTPLTVLVFQVGYPQQGKSRLHTVAEEIFETCDDVVAGMAQPDEGSEAPFVKSITMQSFTFMEFFYRCAATFPQVGAADGSAGAGKRIWFGTAVNLDEAYGFFEGLGLLGFRAEKDKNASTLNASMLNSLIQSGKMRRATRTSVSFGSEGRGQHVSLSVLGNCHPCKTISMDRGILGSHTAATKERFLFCLDRAVLRHSPLPDNCPLAPGVSPWTWLPLTLDQATVFGWQMYLACPDRAAEALEEGEAGENPIDLPPHMEIVGPLGGFKVAFSDGSPSWIRYMVAGVDSQGEPILRTEYRISSRWLLPDPTEHIHDGARRVAQHFASRPHSEMVWDDEARKILVGNQVAQSLRANASGIETSTAALHANSAGQQGVVAALLSILELAGGGGRFAADGQLLVTVKHVHLARRFVDISVRIRETFRQPLEHGADSDDEARDVQHLSRPVRGSYPHAAFMPPLTSQLAPPAAAASAPLAAPAAGSAAASAASASQDIHLMPRPRPANPCEVPLEAGPGEPKVLNFTDLPSAATFDNKGLGPDGAMIFKPLNGELVFRDRALLRRVLLSGKDRGTYQQLVDSYTVASVQPARGSGAKRPRARPPKEQIKAVLEAAFQQFPRLGEATADRYIDGYALKAWTQSDRGHILYHNDLMTACRVTLAQVSEKRARFYEGHGRAAKAPRMGDVAPLGAPEELAGDAAAAAASACNRRRPPMRRGCCHAS